MPGLYLHIPFCVQKCRYCDFPSYGGQQHRIGEYLHALTLEMDALQKATDWGTFDTVFFGGGTPSLLSGNAMQTLLKKLRSHFCIASDAEITMECNPGTVNEEKLYAYRAAGINRLSIGLQSTQDYLLARIGRIHTAAQFLEAFADARTAGFTNINVDVMHGLPGQREAQYIETLQELIALGPEHISAYGLILEEGTPLFDDVQSEREVLPAEDIVCDMQDAGILLLEQSGYIRYEISNFSKPSFTCRHNLNYWANGAYLGLGAGAHSAWRLPVLGNAVWTRWSNPAALDAYMTAAPLLLAQRALERIPVAEEAFETVMLGLRQLSGLPLDAFSARFKTSLLQRYPHAVYRLIQDGWLELTHDTARLTPHGLDMQNAALQHFLTENGAPEKS